MTPNTCSGRIKGTGMPPRVVRLRGRGPSRLELPSMNDSTTSPEGPNPTGLCMCGCGQPAPIARRSDRRKGWVRGKPVRYLHGHATRISSEGPNPSGLCMCGCGRPAPISDRTIVARGLVRGRPGRYIKWHHRQPQETNEYTEQDCGYETPCWVWNGATSGTGYGVTGARKDASSCIAHRVYYERHIGPLIRGMDIHHKCGNRGCVNPAHLEQVTHRTNLRYQSRVKMTPETAREARALSVEGWTIGRLAWRYGVSRTTISTLLRGVTWNEC